MSNYYFSSFFWSTLQKVINAIIGIISVPLLLRYYGVEQYGILSLATACNSYMHLMDLGMNIGAVRYFTLWRTRGEIDKTYRVARTNITFYAILSFVNCFILIILACFCSYIFSLTYEQIYQMQICLLILALFCVFSWGATTFNQLLISDNKIVYTYKVQSLITILKAFLIGFIFIWHISLSWYFFALTAIIALPIIPYWIKCKTLKLIDTCKPGWYWDEFKIVIVFSLSIFALSLFQVTAYQTRPIILGIFSDNATIVNSEYRIIELIPQFVITISGTFSAVFLPKTTELVEKNKACIDKFVYKWTVWTASLTLCLCVPFILCASEVLSLYVGNQYCYLSKWLVIWIIGTFIQMHTTPANSIIMAIGKTKYLVYTSAFSCILSMIINVLLAKDLGIGSAVIGYSVYIMINISLSYIIYYKKYLNLNIPTVLSSVLQPTLCGLFSLVIIYICKINIIGQQTDYFSKTELFITVFICGIAWLILFVLLLFSFHIIIYKNKIFSTKFG